MVNIIIYLNKSNDPKELVKALLEEKLIANASIDHDNHCYRLENHVLTEDVNTVITVQTKAMLFTEVVTLIMEKYGDSVPIYSIPITQSNHSFDLLIRSTTKKI
jgi:uncharacterized protein involved in tolerance to divalent cations